MARYGNIETVKKELATATNLKTKYHQQYRDEVIAHEETKKAAQRTRFELLLELKGRDDVIDLLNEQIGQMLRRDIKNRANYEE